MKYFFSYVGESEAGQNTAGNGVADFAETPTTESIDEITKTIKTIHKMRKATIMVLTPLPDVVAKNE